MRNSPSPANPDFPAGPRLKRHIEKPTLADRLNLPHHERIEDPIFRRAVDLIDAGRRGRFARLSEAASEAGASARRFRRRELLSQSNAAGVHRRESGSPRQAAANIVEVAKVILDAGAAQSALNETLMLVATGSVPRECRRANSIDRSALRSRSRPQQRARTQQRCTARWKRCTL